MINLPQCNGLHIFGSEGCAGKYFGISPGKHMFWTRIRSGSSLETHPLLAFSQLFLEKYEEVQERSKIFFLQISLIKNRILFVQWSKIYMNKTNLLRSSKVDYFYQGFTKRDLTVDNWEKKKKKKKLKVDKFQMHVWKKVSDICHRAFLRFRVLVRVVLIRANRPKLASLALRTWTGIFSYACACSLLSRVIQFRIYSCKKIMGERLHCNFLYEDAALCENMATGPMRATNAPNQPRFSPI